ncbi:MAG: TolC family protein [Pirellulaceae bacterium]
MTMVHRAAILICLCALGPVRVAGGQTAGHDPPRLTRLPAVTDDLPPPVPVAPPGPVWHPEVGAKVEPLRMETLDDAWAQALAVDQQLFAGAANLESAASAVDAAYAQRHPLLRGSADYIVRDNEPSFRIESPLLPYSFTNPYMQRNNYAFAGLVDVPIYTGGRVTNEIEAAQCNVRTMERRLDRHRLDLKLRVAEHYVAVLRAEQEVSVAISHQRSLAAHARDTDLLHKEQRVPRNDLLGAQVALADAQHQVIKAQSELDACRAAYNRQLGRQLTAPVTLGALEVKPVEQDADTLTEQALAQRPELAELDAQAATRRHQAETAAAARRAQVHVQGAYTFQENEFQTPQGITSAGVGVWWNLYDGGRATNQAQEQIRLAQALSHMRADLQSMIQLEVRRAWLAVRETRDRLAVTRQSIERAEENLRVTRQRYLSGMATNTDVLGAESLRIQTYRNHNNAIYDAALADVRLQRATGGL